MLERDEALAAIRTRLEQARAGEPATVLESDALTEAQRLADQLDDDDDDVEARYLLGLLHWLRYQVLPAGEDEQDLQAAASYFIFCFLVGVDLEDLPAPLLPHLADQASTIGIDLIQRAQFSVDPDLVTAAVDVWRRIVAVTPADHPDRAGMLSILGGALRTRFDRTGNPADLDEAITKLRLAVEVTLADHPGRAAMLSNLGNALRTRFDRTGSLADLDEAITRGRLAVEVTPADHPGRAGMLSILGGALGTRFDRTGSLADLDEAITRGRLAVEVTPADHPGRGRYLTNLGSALRTRFDRTGNPADLDEAITKLRLAVEVTPADHPGRAAMLSNLGNALLTRFKATSRSPDREAAVTAYARAADMDVAAPSHRIQAAREAARLSASTAPGQAADLLEAAVRLLPEVSPRQLERADQQHMIGEFAGLAADAAALALADPGTPAEGERAARALRLLEAGRAVMLSQTLHTRSDLTDLTARHPKLAAQFLKVRDQLDQPTPTTALAEPTPSPPGGEAGQGGGSWQPAQDRHRLAADLAALLEQIRALDGFASFARPPTLHELQEQAAAGPVVTFNVSPYRSDALLLTPDGVTPLPLPDLDSATLINQINAFRQALPACSDPDADTVAAQETVRKILAWLWDAAAGPVLDTLGYRQPPPPGTDPMAWPRVWWAPGGLLGLLPIHAAGHHTDPPDPACRVVLDRVVSSYTPTITTLRYARQQDTRTPPAAGPERVLLVAMPTTPGMHNQGWLPQVAAEAACVRTRFPHAIQLTEPTLASPDAGRAGAEALPTKTNVLAHLPGCAIAHFACHGDSDAADPSRSRLLLHDHQQDPLTVASLAPITLQRARLAYLSACDTAFSRDTQLLDEAIHLAAAFQMAGFPHVIGTLWTIADDCAAAVADTFYATLDTGGGHLDISRAAHALHHAIRPLRDELPLTPSLWAPYLHAGA